MTHGTEKYAKDLKAAKEQCKAEGVRVARKYEMMTANDGSYYLRMAGEGSVLRIPIKVETSGHVPEILKLVDDANRGAGQAAQLSFDVAAPDPEKIAKTVEEYMSGDRPWFTKEQAEELLKGQDAYSCSTFEGFKDAKVDWNLGEDEADQPTVQTKEKR